MLQNIMQSFRSNSLLKNATNLMISSGITALFGFIFWTVIARNFHSETVGLATTLLAMSGLLSSFGLAGFDTVFVRFLPKSTHRNEHINSGLIIAGLASAIIAGAFCILIPVLSPKLSFVNQHPLYILSFIIFTVFNTWNNLTSAVLVAYRKTSFVVIINIIFSAVKMTLPFVIHHGGPMTIFMFAGAAQVINVVLSLAALWKYCNYLPALKVRFDILRETRRYGMASYASNILNLLPDSALPLIVIDMLGATAAAYFYIAFTVANLLYTIAFATNQALLAEAAHEEGDIVKHTLRGLKITASLLIPTTIIVILISPIVLSIFGHGYSRGATGIVRVLCLSSIPVMFYSALSFIFKQTKNLQGMITMTTVNAAAIISISLVLTRRYGLPGIGWAWLLGTCLSVTAGGYMVVRARKTV
jgi:O-antigen/teichoic acid export membrane protein